MRARPLRQLPAPTWLPVSLLLLAAGCGYKSYVKTDDAALGRVVVYRNGVAFYERRAQVLGDALSLKVPADKVDDFLKSLTVADAKTGQPLPVSFPNTGIAAGGGNVEMTVRLPPAAGATPGAPRDVILTYVTEAPAWKPSYRLVIDERGKVALEGWAIVDNTSGEDWTAVKVGVGSSSALAFRYDLHSVRLVHRDILQTQERFAMAPPTGGSTYRTDGTGARHVIDEMGDADLPMDESRLLALADVAKTEDATVEEAAVRSKKASARSRKRPQALGGASASGAGGQEQPVAQNAPGDDGPALRERQQQAQSRVRALAEELRHRGSNVTIEGYADAGESDAPARALERANNLRNELIKQGVAPAQVQVAARGVVAGQKAGVRLVEQPVPAAARKDGDPARDGDPVGESHFESGTPMTVGRGTSAMVAILKDKAAGEIVYLYDSESERGDGRYAFRSVLFKNPTGSTLESGPVTVYGEARFIGEGLTEAIPPRATAVVPFALDRQVVIERQGEDGDRIAQLTTLARGVLTCEVQHKRTTRLRITNRLPEATTVLVRHSTGRGWKVAKAPQDSEQYGASRLYRVKLAGGETRTVEIEEVTPMQRTLDLRSADGLAMVEAYLKSEDRPPAFAAQMDKILKLNREQIDTEEAIGSLRQRGDEFRQRVDELHGQIVTLGVTKTGGTLTAHLQAKMKEISNKVQQNTLAIVDQQEKLMLARVGFQDAIAELTLGEGAAKKVATR